MLELGGLLLRRCGAAPTAASVDGPLLPALTVHDARTGALVGSASWRRSGSRWLRWLRRPILEVRENEDAPLVFTAHRCWGVAPHWEVRDADGNTVGLLYGSVVKDRFGRNLALADVPVAGWPVCVRDAEGRELMALTEQGGEARLAFGPAAEGNPFLKMLLLAIALLRR